MMLIEIFTPDIYFYGVCMLISVLRELSNDLSARFSKINHGGCGKVAAVMYEQLMQVKNVSDVKIVCVDYKRGWRNTNKHNLNHSSNLFDDLKYGDIDWAHILVSFKYRGRVYCADSAGVQSRKQMSDERDYVFHDGEIPIETLLRMNREFCWNWTFNTKQMPRISKAIRRAFDMNITPISRMI